MVLKLTPSTWPPETEVTLCRVPWDAAYKDVWRPASVEERDAYFASLEDTSIKLERVTYARPNAPVKISVPYSEAYTYNYLVVRNPQMPVDGEVAPPVLYYFITSHIFEAPNTTTLILQLDIMQTYMFSWEFGKCFVDRGHAAIQATQGTIGDYGATKRKYLTAPENLDIGSEYVIVDHDILNLADDEYKIVIVSSVDLTTDPGTIKEPNLETARGGTADKLLTGCDVYVMSANTATSILAELKKYPHITKGILSITAIPGAIEISGYPTVIAGYDVQYMGRTPDEDYYYQTKDLVPLAKNYVGNKYRHLKKFGTYPYSVYDLVPFNGQQIVLKPELCGYEPIGLQMLSCAAPPFVKIGFYPHEYGAAITETGIRYNYNAMDYDSYATLPTGYALDNAAWITNMPQFSIVNDGYLSYMLSNARALTYQYDSAGWQATRASRQITTGHKNALESLDNDRLNQTTKNVAGIANAAVGLAGIVSLDPGGAVASAAQTGINVAADNEQFWRTNEMQSIQQGRNAQLALDSNETDYQMAIAGINATVQDASLTQPSISGQAGGEGFNLSNGRIALEIRLRMIDEGHVEIIGDYWCRYGYAIQRYIDVPNDLHCMDLFTYWRMSEVYLTVANCAEFIKDAIRGVFKNGVTIWQRAEDIGRVEIVANRPLPGSLY